MLFLSTAETCYHCVIFKPTSDIHAVQFSHSVFLIGFLLAIWIIFFISLFAYCFFPVVECLMLHL